MIPFVLTGTIIPNAVRALHNDPVQRRQEYIGAIRHYLAQGPVWFIENSAYKIREDPFFLETPGLRTVQLPLSAQPERGKGYQEFEMLDRFVGEYLDAPAFIKISGRYRFKNIGDLAKRIPLQLTKVGVVMDLIFLQKKAIVSLFAVSRSFYASHIMGAYHAMNDEQRAWAEYVLYPIIRRSHDYTFLQPAPFVQCIAGSNGQVFDMPEKGLKPWLKTAGRKCLSVAGIREVLF